jgi:hypothetical protein
VEAFTYWTHVKICLFTNPGIVRKICSPTKISIPIRKDKPKPGILSPLHASSKESRVSLRSPIAGRFTTYVGGKTGIDPSLTFADTEKGSVFIPMPADGRKRPTEDGITTKMFTSTFAV